MKSNGLTLVSFSGGAKSTMFSLDSGEVGDSTGISVFGAEGDKYISISFLFFPKL